MKLRIKGTYIRDLTQRPKEVEVNQVLHLAGILSPQVAEKLKIREGCFNDEGVPRQYESFPSPKLVIDGADVTIGGNQYRSTLVHKFKIAQPKNGGESDVSLEVSFRCHFGGKVPLTAVLANLLKTEFDFGINAAQEDLKFGDDEADKEEDADEQPELELSESKEATLAPAAAMRRKKVPVEVQ
jgi:hypothetical protein